MGKCQHDWTMILNNCWVSPRVLLLCHNVHDSKTINNTVTGFQLVGLTHNSRRWLVCVDTSFNRDSLSRSPVGCSKWFCGMFEVVLEWLNKKIFTVLESITCSSTHVFSLSLFLVLKSHCIDMFLCVFVFKTPKITSYLFIHGPYRYGVSQLYGMSVDISGADSY